MKIEKSQGAFIMIYNSFISEGKEQHLTDKELYMYGLLYREITLHSSVRTSLSLLSDFSPIKFSKRKVRETTEMKELLLNLIQKEVIQVCNADGEKIDGNIKATESIVISFLPVSTRYFTMIPFNKFEEFETIRNFYIYTVVKRWMNDNYFECNYDRWSDILRCSRHSAIKYIEEAVNKGIIYKNTGDYQEDELEDRPQKVQSMNQYKIVPFTEEEKTRITKKNDYLEEKAMRELSSEENVVVKFPIRTLPENVSDMF